MTWLLPDRSIVERLQVRSATVKRAKHRLDMTRRERWHYSAKGVLWLIANAEKRRAYQRAWYAKNREKRREYLNSYQREMRRKK